MNFNINLLNYINSYIGSTSWAGETNHDNESSLNMNKLETVVLEIEDIYARLLQQLADHKKYREGNASAYHLHQRAKEILERRKYAYEDIKYIMDDLENWDVEDEK